MAFKIIHQSSDPAFVLFPIWINQKLDDALASGNTAEHQKISDAITAKNNANQGDDPGTTVVMTEDGLVKNVCTRPFLSQSVPEFDFYWNQWKDQFNVQIIIEEV